MPKLGIEIKRKCKFCGKAFIIKTLDSIYCCKKCSEAAYAQKKRAEAKEKKLALLRLVPQQFLAGQQQLTLTQFS